MCGTPVGSRMGKLGFTAVSLMILWIGVVSGQSKYICAAVVILMHELVTMLEKNVQNFHKSIHNLFYFIDAKYSSSLPGRYQIL